MRGVLVVLTAFCFGACSWSDNGFEVTGFFFASSSSFSQKDFDELSSTCLEKDAEIVLPANESFVGPLELTSCDTTTPINLKIRSSKAGRPVTILGSKSAKELGLSWEKVAHPITELNSLVVYRLGPLSNDVLQMYDDGVRLQLASTQPFISTISNQNGSYIEIDSITPVNSSYEYKFVGGQLETFFSLLAKYGGSSEIQGLVRTNFFSFKKIVFSDGAKTDSLLTPTALGFSAAGGTGFGLVLANSPILMDEAGEWYYHQQSKYVYYIPLKQKSPPESVRIVFDVPSGASGSIVNINLNSFSSVSIEDVELKQGALYGLKVRNFLTTNLSNLSIQGTEGFGLDVQVGTSVLATGMSVQDTPSFAGLFNNINTATIQNSTFAHNGFLANQRASVMGQNFAALRATLIRNELQIDSNSFSDSGYAAVSLSENLKKSYVSNNSINGYCTLLSDCGAVYVINNGKDVATMTAVIQTNRIRGGVGNVSSTPWTSTASISPGVYLDNGTSYNQVLDNDIADMKSYVGGIYIHYGNYNTVLRNKVKNGSGAALSMARESNNPMSGNFVDANNLQVGSNYFSAVWLIDSTKVYTDMASAFGIGNTYLNTVISGQDPFSYK